MQQRFEYDGKFASLYSTSDGKLAFGEIIETFVTKHCKTVIFESIADSDKGKLGRKTTTPKRETIDLLCNPPAFFGDTDDRLRSSRIVAGNVSMFISGLIPPSNSPIKIQTANPKNLGYVSRLISRDEKFTLDDFQSQIYPDMKIKNRYDHREEDANKRHKGGTNNSRLITAVTEQQMNMIMNRYVDENVIAHRPFKCALEAKIRQGIDEQEFIDLSNAYTDRVIIMMNIQMPLLLKKIEIDGNRRFEIVKREEAEKLLTKTREEEEKLNISKREQDEILNKSRREQDEILIKSQREENEKLEEKKTQEFEKMKIAEEKLELQKQATLEIDLKKEKESTKQATINAKVETKRLTIREREVSIDATKQKEADYRLNLEVQLAAANRRAVEKQFAKNAACKKDYVEAYIACQTKFFDSMSGECVRCTARTAHFGSAGVFNATAGDLRLFCACCIPKVKREKKHLGTFFQIPTIEDKNLATWIRVNGPHFKGICSACMHPLEYINYEMAHNSPSMLEGPAVLENLRVSCASCNNAGGVNDFDKFKNARYPDNCPPLLSNEDAKEAAMIMNSKICVPLSVEVLRHGKIVSPK